VGVISYRIFGVTSVSFSSIRYPVDQNSYDYDSGQFYIYSAVSDTNTVSTGILEIQVVLVPLYYLDNCNLSVSCSVMRYFTKHIIANLRMFHL
jgi:hypothetical protein